MFVSFLGVLEKIQDFFDIGNSEAGLLQTVFVCSYMALAPLFGYLGWLVEDVKKKYNLFNFFLEIDIVENWWLSLALLFGH